MDAETIFRACNLLVVPAWVLLAVAPRWRWSAGLIAPAVVPALLAAVYLLLVATNLGSSDGSFSSLRGISALFANPYTLLAGWIHYLAFDLFIGAWEVRDSQRLAIPHLYVLPCLLFTFLLGPIGLLAYLSLRTLSKRSAWVGRPDAA